MSLPMRMMRSGIEGLLDTLFPSYCICCQERLPVERRFICERCFDALPRYRGHEIYYDVSTRLEGYVPYSEYHADLVFTHANAVRDLIHYIKYRHSPELGTRLVRHFLPEHLALGHFVDTSLVVPVPISRERLRRRGYNQAEYLAAPLAEGLGCTLATSAVRRIDHHGTQTTRSRAQRWQAMEGIFRVEDPGYFLGRRVLLVDDLLTSGATLIRLAQAILADGAESVSYYTLAVDEKS